MQASNEERAKGLFFQATDLFDAEDFVGTERLLREALTLVPERSSILGNLAAALFKQGKVDDAVIIARRALALDADNASALLTLASAHLTLGHPDQALAAFDSLVALTPADVEAWAGRAKVMFDLSRWSDALACYDRVLALNPGYEHIKGQRVFARLQAADWDGIEEDAAEVVADVRRSLPASPPFQFLAISDSAADQKACIAAFAAHDAASVQPNGTGERYTHDRIRIAYMSPDFRDHAMTFLAAGLFEHHDRDRFETIALSLGPDDGSEMRRTRLPAAFERFIDVRGNSDAEIVTLIRDLEVDISIDLAGYTTGGRTGVLVTRPAPVQVNYLGFPATMGAAHHDYIIGDRVVIPEESRPAMRRTRLPAGYFQVNDDRRPLPKPPPVRGWIARGRIRFLLLQRQLQAQPADFDVWMRLFRSVPGSILWLVAAMRSATPAPRGGATEGYRSPERLIFA